MNTNYSNMMVPASNCRPSSFKEVNGKIIPTKKLGLVVCEDVNEFFWFTENSVAPAKERYTPLFLDVPQEITEFIEAPRIIQVYPGDYFIADGILYYYDVEKFEVYRVLNYFSLDMVYRYAQTAGYDFHECSLVKLEKEAKEYYCWLLKLYTEEDEESFTIYALPVFGEYAKEVAAIDWTPADITPLKNGDSIIKDDKLYLFEIKPDSIQIIEQDIDFDFNNLFK